MSIAPVKNIEKLLSAVSVAMLLLACGCGQDRPVQGARQWTLTPIGSVKGFNIPECAEVNPADGTVYVANMFAVTRETVGALDSNGFIATLEPGGKLKKLKTIEGTKDLPVHGPAGM